MDNFKNYIELNEASLNRIWDHVNGRKVFGVISPFRKTNSDKENEVNYTELKNTIKKLRLGFIEMNGGYDEETGFVNEKSLFIPKIKLKDLMNLGKEYDQYSVIHSDGKNFNMIGSNANAGIGKILDTFNYDKRKALSTTKFASDEDKKKFSPDELEDKELKTFFSTLVKGSHKGKKFVFTNESSGGVYCETTLKGEGFNANAYGILGLRRRQRQALRGVYVEGYNPE